MKILFVSDQYYPLGGGIEQYLRGLARQLTIWGHKVVHLTRSIEGCPEEESWPEGRVIRTPLLAGTTPAPEPQSILDRWPQLASVIKPLKPDIVYANNHTSVAAIKACQSLGIPVVYCCHGWGPLCPLKIRFLMPDNSLCYNYRAVKNCLKCYRLMLHRGGCALGVASRIKRAFGDYKHIARIVSRYNSFQDILERADAHIYISALVGRMFDIKKGFIVHLGIDSDVYRPASSEGFCNKYAIAYPYLFVPSRIHNTKGQEWAIKALTGLPKDLTLVLAGNSSMFRGPKYENNIHTERLHKIIKELGLQARVIFTGLLTTEELVQAYSGAAATLVPSVWLDPFPYVTVEAMSCGCPVVVTQNCGTAELVTNGIEGFVVPRMNGMAIAEAILKIMPSRKEMGRAARETAVKRLNWEKTANGVLQVFGLVLK